MGDLNKNSKSPPLSLPPGFRFHPSEQQILSLYLTNKNKNPNLILSSTSSSSPPFLCLDVISEIDLYNHDPYNLPEIDSFPYGYGGNKKHWYYFTVNRKGPKRKSKGGFWKRKCRSRNVLCEKDGILLGTKTSFVFYRRDSSSRRCCRTNWIMIEYTLVDHQTDFFVLCRLYLKTCSANKVIKAGMDSHVEEFFAAKGNRFNDDPCRQLDIPSVSGIGEVVVRDDADNDVLNLPHEMTNELNNEVAVRPFCSNHMGASLGVLQSDQLVNVPNGLVRSGVSFDDIVADELRRNTIFLEGDYLELDDLVGPLLGLG